MATTYLDVYPITTQDMTTAELILEAQRLEFKAAETDGTLVGFHQVRYNFVKRELASRTLRPFRRA